MKNSSLQGYTNSMKTPFFLCLTLFCTLFSCVPLTYTDSTSPSKVLKYTNRVYEKEIRSVKLSPEKNFIETEFTTTILALQADIQLLLEFDDLAEESDNYFLKLLYLKADWSPSFVSSLDYLGEFNEFRIDDYDLSLGTKIPYVHYSIRIPKVKLPGNYLAVVYREGDESDYILSQRFVIFDNTANITGPDALQAFTAFSGHRIDFNVYYHDVRAEDPRSQFKATIRQNGRWDNAKYLISPSFVKEDQQKLEFRFFDKTNSFPPGNEFRFFDIRSTVSPGQNVRGIEREANPMSIKVQPEKSRTGLAYSYHRDLNGGYEIYNLDGGNSASYSEYINVNFELLTDPWDSLREVYVFGELSNWELSKSNRMTFSKESTSYKCALLLKQGWYDYMYYQKSPGNDVNVIMGNHVNTENYYEILVYYLPIGSREERCVGYYQFGVNERNR